MMQINSPLFMDKEMLCKAITFDRLSPPGNTFEISLTFIEFTSRPSSKRTFNLFD